MIQITPEFIIKYVHKGYKHPSYNECVKKAHAMQVHANGEFPSDLIGERRPSESKAVFEYRKKIYQSVTEQPFSKIQNSLAKIRKSSDWTIQYKKKNAKVVDEESLEAYCEHNFPDYESLTNWTFSVMLKQYLVDPNSLIIIYPLSVVDDNSYSTPFPFIFESEKVIDYIPNELAVILSDKKTPEGWDIYYFFNQQEVWEAKQININGQYQLTMVIKHDLMLLPCVKMRAVFCEEYDGEIIYKSRLAPCLPSWNEAVREYSDMQASVVKHMFPTLVIHTNQVCKVCSGTGKQLQIEGKESVQVSCGTCKGSGSIPRSPYEDIQVSTQKAGEVPLPTPIAYYVEKDTEIIKIQDERIDKHLLRGYSAVNFDFLAVGLNQSGIAKELDRSELNAFIYDIAEDIIAIMDKMYLIIAEYRYNVILSPAQRKEILPHIPVPEKYDIISESYLVEQMKAMKDIGANPFLINAIEIEYAQKKFSTDDKIGELVRTSLELDPLAGHTDDSKQILAMNRWALPEDFIISANITAFIRRAMNENQTFLTMEFDKKMEVLRKYAKEVTDKLSAASNVKNALASEDAGGGGLGKIPLGIQQLALARERANTAGDTELAKQLGDKMDELLNTI